MISSAKIQEMVLKLLADGQEHTVQDMKNYLAEHNSDDYTEGQFAGSLNTLLRKGSIIKIDRGVYAVNARREYMKKCFVVSPIGEKKSAARINADKLFKHILVPVCKNCGFEAIRADKLNDANSITQTIIDHLENSELVIADITGLNPNVFYEMGYRARTKKPIIYLKSVQEKMPFDIATIRTLEYDLTDLDNVEEVKARLAKTIESFDFSEDNNMSLEDKPTENTMSAVMPILYQILDSINAVEKEIKNINAETIATVIKSMQSAQQPVSQYTALQIQLLSNLIQNPDNFLKLMEFSEKLSKSKK